MRFKFFVIPTGNTHEAEQELNRFLGTTRVLTVHREFVAAGPNSFWALAVEYLSGTAESGTGEPRGNKPKIDYREVLSTEEFALFAKLRDWRKAIASHEAVPVYTIFTNEQLAEVARQKIASLSGLHTIEGVGEARIKKYGAAMIAIVNGEAESAPGWKPLSPDL